jgi:hypothetical protein
LHYRSRLLCQGPQALGKASKALGKAFAERSSWQSALGENPIGKGFFAEPSARRSVKREIKNTKKPENFLKSGEGPTGQCPSVSVEVASRDIFRAKFAATRSAGFELVTSSSRDTSSATCTTHSHASVYRFGYSNIILNQVKIDCLMP